VFKADRLLYHSTLGLRVIKKKREDPLRTPRETFPNLIIGLFVRKHAKSQVCQDTHRKSFGKINFIFSQPWSCPQRTPLPFPRPNYIK